MKIKLLTICLIVALVFAITVTFTFTAVAKIKYVRIDDAPNGDGYEVDTHSMTAGETLTVYAVGYTAAWIYESNETVTWSGTGVVTGPDLSPISGTSTTFTAATAGDGTITADHATVTDDTTGTITVTPVS